jgi:2'-5' RNA ligase
MGGARAVGISLWLAPESAGRERLGRLIAELAGRLGTPPFEPHVTLLGGLTLDESQVRARCRHLARRILALPLRFRGIEGTDEYFRCLYLRVSETDDLLAAHNRAREEFGLRQELPFVPHLSLLYGHVPPATREALIAELQAQVPPGFLADRLEVVRTEGPPGDWRRLDSLGLGR